MSDLDHVSTPDLMRELARRSKDCVIILGRPDGDDTYRYHATGSREWILGAMMEVRQHVRLRGPVVRASPHPPRPPFCSSPLNLSEGGGA